MIAISSYYNSNLTMVFDNKRRYVYDNVSPHIYGNIERLLRHKNFSKVAQILSNIGHRCGK
jgi:hypothetical protein